MSHFGPILLVHPGSADAEYAGGSRRWVSEGVARHAKAGLQPVGVPPEQAAGRGVGHDQIR
jgi:hypothetical protein